MVVKRKNDSKEVKTEPAKKALKKNDLLIKYNNLQQKYDALEQEHKLLGQDKKQNIEAILMLEETVKLLDIQSSKWSRSL